MTRRIIAFRRHICDKRRMLRFLICLAVLFAIPSLARAEESNVVRSPQAAVSIVSANSAVQGRVTELGLLLHLQPGWHIYWSDPGDAGQPPSIHLLSPPGAKFGGLRYPAPSWLQAEGLGVYVETGTVLLPFTLELPTPPSVAGIAIHARARWLVCNPKICLPESGEFGLHLPRGTPTPSKQAALFAAAAHAEPHASPFRAAITPKGILIITGAGVGKKNVQSAHFYPFSPNVIENASDQKISFLNNGFLLHLKLKSHELKSPLKGVIEITAPSGHVQVVRINAISEPEFNATPHAPFFVWIGAALLGGLILNLMPCVFPVLAMKAFAIAKMGADDRKGARQDAIAYAAGAVVATVVLGGGLLALRAGGMALGWGFQFQSPTFVAAMAWLVFAIGLNFVGLFEFRTAQGLGSGVANRGDLLGSFATGLLAVVVATPCTAPFMAGAIAAALAAPIALGVSVFGALGLGISLPFVLLAVMPGVGRVLPKPGPWMTNLKQFLAFPMFATAIWLLWLMATEVGASGVLVVAVGALLIAFALWLLRFRGWWPRGVALISAVAALFLLPYISPSSGTQITTIPDAIPFSRARLDALRAEGKPVFVDVGAAWCITCQVNERVALAQSSVRQSFASHGVTLMYGNWTRRERNITAFLSRYHRDGVPFYVYFPPSHAPAKLLPQILTPTIVRGAIESSKA